MAQSAMTVFCLVLLFFSSGLNAYTENVENFKFFTDSVQVGAKVLRPESGEHRLLTGEWLSRSKFSRVSIDVKNPIEAKRVLIRATEGFLLENSGEFFREGQVYRLNSNSVFVGNSEQFLSFDVMLNGLKIEDAHVEFRFKFGKLIQVQNFSFVDAKAPVDRAFSSHVLSTGVAQQLGASNPVRLGTSLRVVETLGAVELIEVDQFRFVRDGNPFRVQVNTSTGEIFEVASEFYFATGTAQATVYDRSWLDTPTVEPISFGQVFFGTASTYTDFDGMFNHTSTSVPKFSGLKGKRVSVRASTGTLLGLTGVLNPEGDSYSISFVPNPDADIKSDKSMAQAMVYEHVNRIVDKASQYINPSWFTRQLGANVNISKTCNAMWNGSTINFYSAGNNCANTALSADVVYHEWGHGLDSNTGGISDGAFSEGYGDIMSLVMTDSPELGVGFRANGNGIRELETDKIYPKDKGEVHAEGLIIGSTFYDLLTELKAKHGDDVARNMLANFAFKVIYTARRYTDVYNALLVIDDDDADLSNATPNYCILNGVFTAHGLAKANPDCNTL